MTKLSEMQVGQKGFIKILDQEDVRVKLMEMGCLPGVSIEVENIAPLGDPMAIQVAGYRLSLRKQDARIIWVELE